MVEKLRKFNGIVQNQLDKINKALWRQRNRCLISKSLFTSGLFQSLEQWHSVPLKRTWLILIWGLICSPSWATTTPPPYHWIFSNWSNSSGQSINPGFLWYQGFFFLKINYGMVNMTNLRHSTLCHHTNVSFSWFIAESWISKIFLQYMSVILPMLFKP